MAYFRCGSGGMPAGLQSGMDAVLNKKFGTSTTYPPSGWPSDVNLLGPLPVKTASGAIASFSDGADDVPTKSLIVTIPPTLTGVSSVTETQTGKNILNTSAFETYSNWRTDLAPNGSYPTGNANRGFEISVKSGATYAVSFGMDAETFPTYLYLCRTDGTTSERLIYFSGANFSLDSGTFTAQSGWTYYFRLGNTGSEANFNTQIAKLSFEQIELGSTVTTYSPYNGTQYTASLGRTIYGGQVDIVNGTGTDENGNVFTFTGQEVPTRLGYNAFWSEQGDTSISYRADIDLLLNP